MRFSLFIFESVGIVVKDSSKRKFPSVLAFIKYQNFLIGHLQELLQFAVRALRELHKNRNCPHRGGVVVWVPLGDVQTD